MARKTFGTIILAAILASAGAANASDAPLTGSDARLSPDGSKVAVTSSLQGRSSISVHSLVDGGKDGKIVRTDDFDILWVRWKDDRHLIAGVRKSSDRSITRLVSLDANGEHVKMIGEPADGFSATDIPGGTLTPMIHPRRQDNVLSILPRRPGVVLQSVMDWRTQTDSELGAALYSVEVETGRHQLVDKGDGRISTYVIDRNGTARIGIGSNALNLNKTIFARASGTDAWTQIRHLGSDMEAFTPLAFTPEDPNLLYVLSSKGGDGTGGLWSFDVTAKSFAKLIDDQANIYGSISVEDGELLSYTRKDGSRFYLNPAWQADYLAVAKAMKGAETRIVDRSTDGAHVLLEVHKPQEPKVWWVLDRTVKPLNLWAAIEDRSAVSAAMTKPSR